MYCELHGTLENGSSPARLLAPGVALFSSVSPVESGPGGDVCPIDCLLQPHLFSSVHGRAHSTATLPSWVSHDDLGSGGPQLGNARPSPRSSGAHNITKKLSERSDCHRQAFHQCNGSQRVGGQDCCGLETG
ncbi:hypothetical protein CABS01_17184 [Colletotrichum abscissum]|uniref:uncharacterized protein n=1 Tax=Colletotrichum abscissum TaxID=1671311 RepID=UPI0027D69D05|nr:uncharacterized protein CABS01_17184 [Colletotrichum abscissum]KAK1486406.1 hypothetical protein CABS01_17184 [Colletotrichum abscissum]